MRRSPHHKRVGEMTQFSTRRSMSFHANRSIFIWGRATLTLLRRKRQWKWLSRTAFQDFNAESFSFAVLLETPLEQPFLAP
ncbi:hypothetical protein ABKN59_007470 [Abortiporus biennis]